jgi:phosphohistidine phosphatase
MNNNQIDLNVHPSLLNHKYLLLMRHAKTESPYTLQRDFDRKLTQTGEGDAQKMGEWLKNKQISIDQILSSSAERTRQTTEIVATAIGIETTSIEFKDELYHATPAVFFNVIRTVSNTVNTLLIVSHNDGITHLANSLTDARIDYMQPGSVFMVKADCQDWFAFEQASRSFVSYRQPS